MKKVKRLSAIIMAVILVIVSGITALAANPQNGETLYVDTRTNATNSATGQYYKDDVGSSYRYFTVREFETNPVYCIEKGQTFTRTFYKAENLSSSAYWQSFSPAIREGIALAAAFGYPAQSPAELGVSTAMDAYVGTQAIIWEYEKGIRTSPSQAVSDTRYQATVAGTPAGTAYAVILDKINRYISDPRYNGSIQSTPRFVCLTSASASSEQAMICYYGDTPVYQNNGKIVINKTDANGNRIDNAEFSVYDTAGNQKYSFVTNSGYANVEEVPFGTYVIVETKCPPGFVSDGTTTWTVTLDANSPNATVTVNAVNIEKKGKIIIQKTGEGLIGSRKQIISGYEVTVPVYGAVKQPGAVYGVYAKTEIKSAAGTHKYNAGDKVGEIKTLADGIGSLGDLYLGEYFLKEISVPNGLVLDSTEYDVSLTDNGGTEQLITINKAVSDERQKLRIKLKKSFEKNDAVNSDEAYKECFFGVFTDETVGNGTYTIPKDTLVGLFPLDANCTVDTTSADLPLGKYYVTELSTSEEYIPDDTMYKFEFKNSLEAVQTIEINSGKEIENRLKYGSIITTKVDTDYPENRLSCAVFEIYRDTDNDKEFSDTDILVSKMTETETGVYTLSDLVYGGYFLYEKTAPDGYVRDTEYYYFEITENGQTAVVTNNADKGFKNNKITGYVKTTKVDAAFPEHKLSGAVFQVYYDTDGDRAYSANDILLGELNEESDGIYTSLLPYGKYLLHEKRAPEGFILDADYYPFEIVTDGETVEVENKAGVGFINRQIPNTPVTPTSPKTGDSSQLNLWIFLSALSGLAVIVLTARKYKKI